MVQFRYVPSCYWYALSWLISCSVSLCSSHEDMSLSWLTYYSRSVPIVIRPVNKGSVSDWNMDNSYCFDRLVMSCSDPSVLFVRFCFIVLDCLWNGFIKIVIFEMTKLSMCLGSTKLVLKPMIGNLCYSLGLFKLTPLFWHFSGITSIGLEGTMTWRE